MSEERIKEAVVASVLSDEKIAMFAETIRETIRASQVAEAEARERAKIYRARWVADLEALSLPPGETDTVAAIRARNDEIKRLGAELAAAKVVLGDARGRLPELVRAWRAGALSEPDQAELIAVLEALVRELESSTLPAQRAPQAYVTEQGILKLSPHAIERLGVQGGGGVVFLTREPRGVLILSNEQFLDEIGLERAGGEDRQ